jgi:hypothetical protein
MNDIEDDMNLNNSISKTKKHNDSLENIKNSRKRREELSISSSKCLKKEKVEVVIKFV